MIFSSTIHPKTWDTWMHYRQGTYYLYYLISERYPGDGIGSAVSQDGVHWKDHGQVIAPSDQMVRYMGSGSVWKETGPNETENYICCYSEWRSAGDRNVQNILFARSSDLIHWEKLGDDLFFPIDERFYKKFEEQPGGAWNDPRWDGINVVPRWNGTVQDGYYGYWTATPKSYEVLTQKSIGFGFGVSPDGLHWEALEPPVVVITPGHKMRFIEVGGVCQIEGRYYAMLADYASNHCGMFSFVADQPEGPFRPAPKNFCLLGNQSKMHAYFTRFVETPDGVLVIHHSVAEGQFSDAHFSVYLAPLKKAVLMDRALYLAWWKGNENLKANALPIEKEDSCLRFNPDALIVLEGKLDLPARLFIHQEKGGTWIRVGADGITEIGPGDGINEDGKVDERIDREIAFSTNPRFRLLVHCTMLEFYLDDLLIQCYSMPTWADGMIEMQGARDLRLWSGDLQVED